jgi:magnesium transporter
MTNTLFLPELREMLAESNVAELREFCTALHPARTAEFMEGLTSDEAWQVIQHADDSTRAALFGYFPRDRQLEVIEHQDRAAMGRLIAELPQDDRVDILKDVPTATVDELLPLIPAVDRRDILRLRAYAEGTAGAMMTTGFARLGEGVTVRQAWEQIGQQAEDLETIYYMYLVDDEEHLRGVVSAKDLVRSMSKPNTLVDDLAERAIVSVEAQEDQGAVAEKVAQYDLHAIPVVDHEHHLLGIITHDDVIDVMREEATEDAYRLGAVEPMEENYLEVSFATIWRKRSVWLSCLFVAEIFTFNAMESFNDEIQKVSVLAMLVPLCISTGGNSGSQAATLITRAMAMGHVKLHDWLKVLRHELGMGLALGATLGAIAFGRAFLTKSYVLGGVDVWQLAQVMALSVTSICLWGTLVGSMLPLMFRRVGVDPGYASSPFVATFVDVTGIIIFFNIARHYITQLH